jgi:hypothetical protein
MGDAVQSLISVHSLEVESKLSVLSTSTIPKQPNGDPHPATPTPDPGRSIDKAKPTVKVSSTHDPKVTNTSQVGKGNAGGGGVSGGVIAAIVIVILVVAAGAGFLFWRRRRQKTTRARSGVWLESGSAYEASSKPPGDLHRASPSAYMFNGSGQNGVSVEPRPLSIAPPPPAKEEKPESPSEGTTLLNPINPQPPSPAHSPRPRTPESPTGPYTHVRDVLAHSHHVRTDSGPMLLYSTPRQDDYYGGSNNNNNKTQPTVLPQSPLVSTQSIVGVSASSFPEPNTPTSLRNAPPMPVPVPEPVPAPPSPTPTPALQIRTQTPSMHSMHDNRTPTPPSSPPPPAYTVQAVPPSPASSTPPLVLNNNKGRREIYSVVRTYVPTLLDELRISVGDRVIVVNEFDDGWGYCEKVGDPDGAAGVVPLECLDRGRNLASPLPFSVSPVPSLAPSDPHLSGARFSSFHVDFDQINNNRV